MIIGVDHVGLSCTNVREQALLVESDGFRCAFVAEKAPNAAGKRSLLHSYRPHHSIAFVPSSAAVAIELIDHGPELGRPATGCPRPLIGGPPLGEVLPVEDAVEHAEEAEALRALFGIETPELRRLPSIGATYWYDAAATTGPGVRALVVPTRRLDATVDYWRQTLGCRHVRSLGRWVHLRFAAPVKRWCLDVALCDRADCLPSYLDDAGFPVTALLSTDIERDGDRLQVSGAVDRTGIATLEMNGRTIAFEIFRTPTGELVELLQVNRSPDRIATITS